MAPFRLVSDILLQDYKASLTFSIVEKLAQLKAKKDEPETPFTFYNAVSVVASSRIEGEAIELDSFLKHKLLNTAVAEDLLQKPNDLYEAYLFAQRTSLNKENFLEAHKILSAHLLQPAYRGRVRTGEMIIINHQKGTVEYEACPAETVSAELDKLFIDISALINIELSPEETFYYAAFVHLVFVKIHPFDDGNGRAGRLLEKWFLSAKLGPNAWKILSEKMYYDRIDEYYDTLNRTGFSYDRTNYSSTMPFLRMLPEAL